MTSPIRTLLRLVAGVLLLVAMAPVRGQDYPDQPHMFAPGDAQDGQIFAAPDLSAYGGHLHPGPHTGFFFEFDLLAWSVSKADVATIGEAGSKRLVWVSNDGGMTDQRSDTTTEALQAAFTTGERFEFGYAGDYHGWMCTISRLDRISQRLDAGNADMVFDDPVVGQYGERHLQGGVNHIPGVTVFPGMPSPPYIPKYLYPLVVPVGYTTAITAIGATPIQPEPVAAIVNIPITFDTLSATQSTDMWDVEMLYLRRFRQLEHGGSIEFYFGARYMEFNERFNVSAVGGSLADSFWGTDAHNRIIGPEIGGKWSKQTGRWKFSAGARFTAGCNMQAARQEGELGSKLLDPGKGMPDTIGYQQLSSPLPITGTALPTGSTNYYYFAGNASTPGSTQFWANQIVNNAGTIWYMTPTAFKSTASEQVFSPVVELKAEVGYQLTRSMALKAAWNGMWVDGLARPSSLVRYRVPDLGIDMSKNMQEAILTGVNIGIEINR